MHERSVFGGIRSTACLGESSPFHSIPLSQWHSSRRRKKCADFCEVTPKEEDIDQFFDLGHAAAVITKDFHGLYILP